MTFADRSIALHVFVFSTIPVLFLCAANRSVPSFTVTAGLFALAMVFAGLKLNSALRQGAKGPDAARPSVREALGRHSYLVGLAYAWSGVALLAIYPWSGLTWRHGWQYGAAMALIASGIFIYLSMLKRSSPGVSSPGAMDTAVMLAGLQGVLITVGIIYLVFSGKLWAGRSDWAANVIFITGGGTITLLSVLEGAAHLLVRRAAGVPG